MSRDAVTATQNIGANQRTAKHGTTTVHSSLHFLLTTKKLQWSTLFTIVVTFRSSSMPFFAILARNRMETTTSRGAAGGNDQVRYTFSPRGAGSQSGSGSNRRCTTSAVVDTTVADAADTAVADVAISCSSAPSYEPNRRFGLVVVLALCAPFHVTHTPVRMRLVALGRLKLKADRKNGPVAPVSVGWG